MPQLELTGLLSQIFWLFINFGIIYFIVSHYISPNLQKVMLSRDKLIASNLEEAKNLKIKAELLKKQYEQEIITTKKTAINIISEAEKKAKLEKDHKLLIFDKKIEDEYIESKNQIISEFTAVNKKNSVKAIVYSINNNLLDNYFYPEIINGYIEDKFK